jgi:FtsP/CotA-like multicopper oxidase with cupredoxin domain
MARRRHRIKNGHGTGGDSTHSGRIPGRKKATMIKKIITLNVIALFVVIVAMTTGATATLSTSGKMPSPQERLAMMRAMPQMRADAAAVAAKQGVKVATNTTKVTIAGKVAAANTAAATSFAATAAAPLAAPDYFGNVPNYANSPLPLVDPTTGAINGGIRKFVDTLPGLGAASANDLGQYIPVASTTANQNAADGYDPTNWKTLANGPQADYYWIGVVQYTAQMSKDLPATTLRGYVQLTFANTGHPIVAPNQTTIGGQQLYSVDPPEYLGPVIIAQKDKPVRVKFSNLLATGSGGNLFLPVDTSIMGAGTGPNGGTETYTQNRATLHLHGGNTPWISDGTEHQWITPAGETTSYPKGVSVKNVPDMGTSCDAANSGCQTFYYTNEQSARLLFYHDHAYGMTRLNVYAGEAAGYIVQDPSEQGLVSNGTIPADQIPLVIQDKTFVPDAAQLAAEDPTWDSADWGGKGNLWFPHVYMPNQNPDDPSGANPMGRWDYGPWFWPPFTGITNGPVPNPLAGQPGEASMNPGTPNPSAVPESFMDTPVVNGTAYPVLNIDPKAYRFRILNAANDRSWNLSLWKAKSQAAMWNPDGTLADSSAGEVSTVPFNSSQNVITPFPTSWYDTSVTNPFDDRVGGVPDPTTSGPQMIQIGTEGGFLPKSTMITNRPINYVMNKRDITVGNVAQKALFLGPAERADVVVDFSQFAGQTLILYNDSPAPVPASDPRNDYYTGDPDQTATGGAPTTLPGYGPNTRTVMMIHVAASTPQPFSTTNLDSGLGAAYKATQDSPLVPESVYNQPLGTSFKDTLVRIQDTQTTFDNGLFGLTGLTLNNGGTGYTSAPTIALTGGGGSGAAATAVLGTGKVASFTVTNGGSGYTSAPTVSISGAGGTGATATAVLAAGGSVKTVTVTAGGNAYTTAPTVTFSPPQIAGGVAATGTAVVSSRRVSSVTITNSGSGYTSAPTLTFSGGGGSGAAATSTLGRAVANVNVVNAGSGYTSAPTVSFSGGGGSGVAATAVLSRSVASLTLDNAGLGYTSAPTVSFSGGGGGGATATATITVRFDLQPKSIIENFDPDYGRMNALLGVEVPNTTGINQTSIPYADVDPPTEVIKSTDHPELTPLGSLNDGTQIWKITHNGVDTHAIHWHMFDVQVINRVGWDGAIRPPDPNELGWKDTVRMNPLEDIIVALRPEIPQVPFDLPNSIRNLDVTMPAGPDPMLGAQTGGSVDPANNPVTVTNHLINFGWEYVWHCHLLGHEENIMMRPIAVAVAPKTPSNLTAVAGKTGATLSWTDGSANETSWVVQRALASSPTTWTDVVVSSSTGPTSGPVVTYLDKTVAKKTAYLYRVFARNTVGDTTTYTAPAVGFPHVNADGTPTANVAVTSL